jgi:putative hemolysin
MAWILPSVVLVLLIIASAFFSGGELALMTLDTLKLETAARRGNRLAILQRRMRGTPQRILSTILLCNNLVNITFATIGTAITIKHLAPLAGLSEERALVISTVVMTLLLVLFGELIPKTLAAIAPIKLASIVTYPLFVIDWLLTPFNWLVGLLMMPLIKLLSGGRTARHTLTSVEDVGTALMLASASGHMHRTDAAVAHEALTFSHKDLSDVMTPRVDIVAVPDTATVGEALTLMTSSGFSRLPVYHGGLDEITGVLMLKDLVRTSLAAAQAGIDPEDRWAQQPCAASARQPAYFPQAKSVVETLAEMRSRRAHLAIVIDEHGGTAGVVSLEDILEELVGDIRDETDADSSADVIRRGADYVIVTGRARIESLPELDDVELGGSEVMTVGGLMMEQLGRPAVVGDEILLTAVKITALKVLRNSIKLMRIERLPAVNGAATTTPED